MCSTCSALAGRRERGASEPNLRNINRIAERAAREEGGLDSMAERAARADGPAQHCGAARADGPAQHCKNGLLLKGGHFAFFEAKNDSVRNVKCPSEPKTPRLAERAAYIGEQGT